MVVGSRRVVSWVFAANACSDCRTLSICFIGFVMTVSFIGSVISFVGWLSTMLDDLTRESRAWRWRMRFSRQAFGSWIRVVSRSRF
ncbi:hypothetical protein FIBSPDRAFT_968329 [Athelia psychrophila]|uniref:Uncharacterized protein n=1 Tax=Athelia psychrophila TaxID=1759441 RepID=A0A167UR56_9AGAM|nr:hypothetical protein FIBSPDRAFT_968329 [Fibularhizoctonia sp. CBS 109695]